MTSELNKTEIALLPHLKSSEVKITSDIIKTSLLSYYRFKRQMIAVDEAQSCVSCESCDVLVYDNYYFHDVEVKISKSDMFIGEAKKHKHISYRNAIPDLKKYSFPNYFLICVPTELVEEARKWVNETNKNYGILEFLSNNIESTINNYNIRQLENRIRCIKRPKLIHSNKSSKLEEILYKRLSSAYITLRQKHLLINNSL